MNELTHKTLVRRKKWFRRRCEDGMGDLRYVAAPAGLLTPDAGGEH